MPQNLPRSRGLSPPLPMMQRPVKFPTAWLWLVDELIPGWVKKTYSPRENWKDKPFAQEDVRFFYKGVEELSELFTDLRTDRLPSYFNHPRFRSSYLLYFLPFQAAKFITLFHQHPGALQAALRQAKLTGALRVADLGSGPGTGSLALLGHLLDQSIQSGEEIPPLEFFWVDLNREILADGRALVEQMSKAFPRLRGKVHVQVETGPWQEARRFLNQDFSLAFFGNVLNELQTSQLLQSGFWNFFFEKTQKGGGVLFLEPAAKNSSQTLSALRNHCFDSHLIQRDSTSIWGPCLHAETCPLTAGKDWCHFSVPLEIPGKWFREFSKALGSERTWAKFSYLWLAALGGPAPKPLSGLKRVISDPLGDSNVLICEPERPGRYRLTRGAHLHRGDLIKMNDSPRKIPAGSLSGASGHKVGKKK